jgi:hypothetical protein
LFARHGINALIPVYKRRALFPRIVVPAKRLSTAEGPVKRESIEVEATESKLLIPIYEVRAL